MKQKNDTLYIPYEKTIVEAVDSIIALANKNGSKHYIQSSLDWETIEYIFNVWQTLYPREYKQFTKSISFFREAQDSSIAKEGNAMIQHTMEIPQHLHQMVKVIFREQNWDKPFLKKLSEILPELETK